MEGRKLFRITGRGVFGIREDTDIHRFVHVREDVDLLRGWSFSVVLFMVGTGFVFNGVWVVNRA